MFVVEFCSAFKFVKRKPNSAPRFYASRFRVMLPSMAASDGPPTKICKRDWENLILARGSYNTLPDDAMHRTTELFAIIEENIEAIRQLNISTNLTDYRKMKVCFAAQMFGTGKTMLGRNLVPQLKLAKSDLQAHLKAFLDKEKAKGEDGRKFAQASRTALCGPQGVIRCGRCAA